MRTAIYCRISQDHTGEGLGVARQLEDCLALAEAQGWTVTEVYSDNDISATSGKPRPEYRRMLAAVAAGEVDAIVAWAPDRLHRRLSDLEELIPLVEKHGTVIKTCRAGDFDLATPLGKMIARILGAVATGEGDVKTDRWKRSVRQRREAGKMPGSRSRLYGYTREGEVIPEEAEVIRWMADSILAGMSGNEVLRQANARGLLTSEGNPWIRSSMKRLLLNPRLAGWASLNGEIMGKSAWPAILDEETWQATRAALNAHNRGNDRPRVSLLPGLIFCGGCGHEMVTGSRMNKRGETVRTYRCVRTVGRAGCQKVSARAEIVEEIVETYTREWLLTDGLRARLEQLREQPQGQGAEVGDLEVRIRELEHQLDQPGVPVETVLRAIDRAKERQAKLLAAMERPAVAVPRSSADWPKDLRRRRALVEIAVERVTVAPSTTPGLFDPERVKIKPR